MKFAVLASPDTWHFRDLKRAAGLISQSIDSAIELVDIDYESISATLSANEPFHGTDASGAIHCLTTFDAVIVRAMPAGSLEQVVFRMDLLGRLFAHGVTVVNSPRTIETAVDKYLSLALLKQNGIPVPATVVCQKVENAITQFELLGGDVVVKPIFGSQGRGLERIRTITEARELFETLEKQSKVFYLQKFVPHDSRDLRALVIGEEISGMSRHNPGHWISNASQGARCEPIELTGQERSLASRSAAATGCSFAGVDLLQDSDGNTLVVEVNACPGWRTFSRVTGTDVAEKFLRHVVSIHLRTPAIAKRMIS